jgi:hypothetical protein
MKKIFDEGKNKYESRSLSTSIVKRIEDYCEYH